LLARLTAVVGQAGRLTASEAPCQRQVKWQRQVLNRLRVTCYQQEAILRLCAFALKKGSDGKPLPTAFCQLLT